MNPQNVGQIVAFTDAREELGDVGGIEPLAQQLIDGLQLCEVVVVVVGRPPLTPRRVEQTAFAVGTDIAGTDA